MKQSFDMKSASLLHSPRNANTLPARASTGYALSSSLAPWLINRLGWATWLNNTLKARQFPRWNGICNTQRFFIIFCKEQAMETSNIQRVTELLSMEARVSQPTRGWGHVVPVRTLIFVYPGCEGGQAAAQQQTQRVEGVTCFVIICSNLESVNNALLVNPTCSHEHLCRSQSLFVAIPLIHLFNFDALCVASRSQAVPRWCGPLPSTMRTFPMWGISRERLRCINTRLHCS